MMNTQHISPEDLALYAMYALSAEEASAVAEHLSSCEICSQEVAQFRGDMALLALTVEQQPLPEGAEERFTARVAAAPKNTAPAAQSKPSTVIPFESAPAQRKRIPAFIPWAAAAGLAAVCISLGIENRNLADMLNSESTQLSRATASAAHAQQIADVLSAPTAQHVTLTVTKHPAEPSAHAVYLQDRGALLFEADNLKPLDPGKTYELWVIPADGKAPVPAGVFKPNSSGYASVVLPQLPPGIAAKAFGVTVENDPGASTPTMPIILAGG
jgi:anti-sigma-K factor RskA